MSNNSLISREEAIVTNILHILASEGLIAPEVLEGFEDPESTEAQETTEAPEVQEATAEHVLYDIPLVRCLLWKRWRPDASASSGGPICPGPTVPSPSGRPRTPTSALFCVIRSAAGWSVFPSPASRPGASTSS